MAHATSFKAGGAVGVLKHNERYDKEKIVARSNETIDPSRTHLNYNLAPKRQGSLMEHIERVCSENGVRLSSRSDLNVMTSWVITAPKGLHESEVPQFFDVCYKFLNERYGEKFVLSATVHLDETTPHLHYGFIPVGFDKKNDRYTVSSKLVMTRSELQRFHKELSKEMTAFFGRDIGIENGETAKAGNRTVQELKLDSIVEQTEQAQKKLAELEGKVLTAKEVNAVKGRKSLFGALKGIPYSEYLDLKKTAETAEIRQKQADFYKTKAEEAQTALDEARSERSQLRLRALTAEADLQNERRHVQKVLERLSPEARQEFARAEMSLKSHHKEKNMGFDQGQSF